MKKSSLLERYKETLPESISLKVKMWEACREDNPLKSILEEDFQIFKTKKNDVTKEELFKASFMESRRLQVSFLPKTTSYEKYGPCATLISVEMTNEEKESLCRAVCEGRKTIGQMKFRTTEVEMSPDYGVHVKEDIIEIDTRDIYEIMIYLR